MSACWRESRHSTVVMEPFTPYKPLKALRNQAELLVGHVLLVSTAKPLAGVAVLGRHWPCVPHVDDKQALVPPPHGSRCFPVCLSLW